MMNKEVARSMKALWVEGGRRSPASLSGTISCSSRGETYWLGQLGGADVGREGEREGGREGGREGRRKGEG